MTKEEYYEELLEYEEYSKDKTKSVIFKKAFLDE